MNHEPDQNAAGNNAGRGMILGATLGLILSPLLGPFSLVVGAGGGLLVGAFIRVAPRR